MDSNMRVKRYEYQILWTKLLLFTFIVCGFFCGLYCIVMGYVGRGTGIYTFIIFVIGGIGIGPGAHRLFSHHSYKVVRGLKIFLIFCHQISGLKSVISWARVHRTHHKFSDTERDPTNINRGIIFACFGWGLISLTPECEYEMNRIHLDDLYNDKDVMFQYKYYPMLYLVITHGLPTLIPFYFWNESIYISFTMNVFRCALNLFQQLIGNGLLHYNGRKPYDKNSTAIDNIFYNILMLGEGFHNFHHTFPFDYRSNELFDICHITSLSTFFIDLCAYLGLAYDRKVAPQHMIANRIARTGDGSHNRQVNEELY